MPTMDSAVDLGTIRQETDANQRRAADPAASVWVSANAGTGKTSVLVRRLLRLLLAGTPPERILCLTYTKTAAAEMENRLFERLESWATQPADDLRASLEELEGGPTGEGAFRDARQLFAKTLETSGGLKIHTIHAFCQRLLHRFPLEAGVPADLMVLDESARARLLSDAIDAVLSRAARDREGALGAALAEMISAAGEEQFRRIIEALLARQETLDRIIGREPDIETLAETERRALARLLGVREDASERALLDDLASVLDESALAGAAETLAGGKSTDQTCAQALRDALGSSSPRTRVAALSRAFLTQAGKPRSRLMTKGVCEEAPETAEMLVQAQDRFFRLKMELAALRVTRASASVLRLACEILEAYETRKAARGALDYDDLIACTVRLLARSDAAAWVLYKLDGGIDHILVDEAQDTSPLQWQVVDLLAAEFFAGESARPETRTVFAVGDEKQSIYSFQGADPARFGEQGERTSRSAAAVGRTWHSVPLTLSFRSTVPVLAAVDAVFQRPEAASGLTWQDATILHHSYRGGEAGLVEIWPLEQSDDAPSRPAFEPLGDRSVPAEASDRLAARIADTIAGWLQRKDTLASKGRPIEPGDVLILVRKRVPFVAPMIRALKARGVPVAGADRMRLGEQLAVMDLMALGEFLLMPEDDLSLATILKSPLFGLDDDALFDLGQGRSGSLWESLRAKADGATRYRDAVDVLEGLLRRVDHVLPYEFYARFLEENGMAMRRRLVRRLGPDAGDAIDEFLDLALAYDRTEPPSLQGFLDSLRRADTEVKRDMEQGRNEVRVMTVHGAKGLEASIVFLPDTCTLPRAAGRPTILSLESRGAPAGAPDHLVWVPAGTGTPAELDAAKSALKTAELEEYHRLLYVAMTRARDRLYVCGYEGRRKRDTGCWYDLVRDGVNGLARETVDDQGRPARRLESSQHETPRAQAASTAEPPPAAPLPEWVGRPAPRERPGGLALAPSAAVPMQDAGASPLDEQGVLPPAELADQARFLRGTIIHALLEHLPELEPERWLETARSFVALRGAGLTQQSREDMVAETLSIMRDADFAPLFGAGSQAEVPIVARLAVADPAAPPLEVSGQIDRLMIREDAVWIVDYKTNRPPPERPEGVAPAYLAQMAVYRGAIRQLFPDRPVLCALLWTAAPRIMLLPDAMLDDYESRVLGQRSGALDAPPAAT